MAKLLVVEDDVALADAVFLHLKTAGHTVQLARNLDDGLKQMRRMKPVGKRGFVYYPSFVKQ